MCLGDWKTHGSEYYECSRYKENPDIVNQSQQAQAREALKKYLFYFERVGVLSVLQPLCEEDLLAVGRPGGVAGDWQPDPVCCTHESGAGAPVVAPAAASVAGAFGLHRAAAADVDGCGADRLNDGLKDNEGPSDSLPPSAISRARFGGQLLAGRPFRSPQN